MHLVVSAMKPLVARYRKRGARRVRDAIEEYGGLADASGRRTRVVFVDEAANVSKFGVPVADPRSSRSIADSIGRIRRTMGAEGTPVSSIVLVGGDHIIPHFRLPNPVGNRLIDPDPKVMTDLPYVARLDAKGRPTAEEVPLGRIPDAVRGRATVFVRTLGRAGAHFATAPDGRGSLALCNREWSSDIEATLEALPKPITVWESPGATFAKARGASRRWSLLYFSLHGYPKNSGWRGFDSWRALYDTAVRPSHITEETVGGSTVLADNCYGGLTAGKTERTSCALKAVGAGARHVVGATGVAFGTFMNPELRTRSKDEGLHAHEFSRLFLQHWPNEATTGASFAKARRDYINKAQQDGSYSTLEQKTALQLVLLGDPAL